jgi:hypothetical protein
MPNVNQNTEIRGNFPWKSVGALTVVAVAGLVLGGCESPISIDNDVPLTVPIDSETHHAAWIQPVWSGKVMMFIPHPAYDTFTFTIDGHQETIRVPAEIAEKYNPGDKIEITYDRYHYKDDPKVYIHDIKLK